MPQTEQAMGDTHVSFTVGKQAVRVFFPFPPYDTQREYVEKVIEALTGGHNAVLESPTGTGKTLSLLCSSLAWLTNDSGGVNKSLIYYTSRTHMQLNQAANEMKRTAYARNPAVVIGSRSKMCLNKDVRSQPGDHLINRACRNAIARNACEYFSNYEQKLEVMHHETVHDIEDLLKFGTSHKCCPYYASKKIAESKASVVFMPYNYLLDTSMRKSVQLRLENSVIIFDEGHNLEGALKDCASGEFTLTCLDVIRESCLKLPEKLNEAINKEKHGLSRSGYDPQQRRTVVRDEFSTKKQNSSKQDKEPKVNPIEELMEKLTNDKLQQVNKCAEELREQISSNMLLDSSCEIDKVFQIMKQSGVHFSTSNIISVTLDSMASFWSIAGVMNPVVVARYVSAITNLSQVISLLFPPECLSVTRQQEHEKSLNHCYAAHLKGIYKDSSVLKQGDHIDSEFNLWCLHPGIGLKRVIDSNCLRGPRSIIVTSGTLAPTHALPKELDTEFKIIKEFKHVINDNQLKMMIIGKSPKGYSLNSDYKSLFDEVSKNFREKYALELGSTLIPLLKVLPFGTLIFFPSYNLLNRVKKIWEKSRTSQEINRVCHLFVEETDQDKFLAKVAAFKRIIDNRKSTTDYPRAAFMGVCRGKLSEGINLEGNHCRTVILIGLPNPSLHDPKIVSTKRFHDKKKTGEGNIWYSQQMTRALNQTIGRVIRSKSDYGMVIFVDPRFCRTKYSLSAWAMGFCPHTESEWDSIDSEVKQFYSQHGVSITESASESCGAFDITFATRAVLASTNRPQLPANFFEDNMSSFSEGTDGSQVGTSQTSNNNGLINTNGSQSVRANSQRSLEERQAEMIAAYTVDRDTFNKAKSRVRPVEGPQEPVKKQKTTVEVFNSIFDSVYSSQQQSSSNGIQRQTNGTSRPTRTQPFACQPTNSNRPNNSTPRVRVTGEGRSTTGNPQQVMNSTSNQGAQINNQVQPSNPAPSQQTKSSSSQLTNRTHEYSILNQFKDKDRPGSYKCCVCLNLAHNPHRTNCSCARVGCLNCLKVLKNKECGKCGTLLKEKNYKQLLFHSASGKEKHPVIVISARQ